MAGWAVNARVLVADEAEGFAAGVIEDVKGIGREATLRLRLVQDEGRTVTAKGREVTHVEGDLRVVQDMAKMDNLSEPVMLQCLRERYGEGAIYASVGGVALAVNPYRPMDALYSKERMEEAFSGSTEMHPFVIAEAAAGNLCRDATSQSVLVSGESGAGKTESTKYVLHYLTFRSSRGEAKRGGVDELLSLTNPVLEAFANAKTQRNDNSSRFGKYVRVTMDPATGRVMTASLASYLLEKVRVVEQLPGERNYHAFYQIARAKLLKHPSNFAALRNCVDVANVDDARAWRDQTEPALAALGLFDENVVRVVEAVLAVRDVDFSVLRIAGEDDASDVSEGLTEASAALGVDADHLRVALTTKPVTGARNGVDASRRARDALAKAIYERLFNGLVDAMNTALRGTQMSDTTTLPFVGLLDIFGFEDFGASKNSLEQLLINLANERLQLHFNVQVFANEAREYEQENVAVAATAFLDNAPVVHAVEQCVVRPLEDESALKSGADHGLVDKFLTAADHLRKTNDTASLLFRPNTRSSANSLFGVRHFAGDVVYGVEGFVAKNRDAVPEALAALVATSTEPSLAALFAGLQHGEQRTGARRGRSNATKKLGVARAFGASLTALAATLEATTPHFIRCIKPNARAAPHHFDGAFVLTQLRYMGVLQIVEARRRGYARRFDHAAFRDRYYAAVVCPDRALPELLSKATTTQRRHSQKRLSRYVDDDDDGDTEDRKTIESVTPEQAVAAVTAALPQGVQTQTTIAVGKTKIFLKVEAYEALETLRDAALRTTALAALARATTAAELEVALRVAASDLRLRGPEVDAARRRLAELRFEEAADDAARALDEAGAASLGVRDLGTRLDAAEAAVARVENLLASEETIRSVKKNGAVAKLLRDEADGLRRRLVALAACARAEAEARAALENGGDDLALVLSKLDASLQGDCAVEAPEVRSAVACRAAVAEALETQQQAERRKKREEDEVPFDVRADSSFVVPPDAVVVDEQKSLEEASRRRQEQDDAEFARRLQLELDQEQVHAQAPPEIPEMDWLSEREKECAARFAACALRAVTATKAEREATLANGICVVKFKAGSGLAAKGDWKLLRLHAKKLVWQPLSKKDTASGSLARVVSKVRSDGKAGVPLEAVLKVTIGPEAPRPRTSFVDAAHHLASQQFGVPSRWGYLTLTTKERDYVFGVPAHKDAAPPGVVDPFFAELLEWATSIERLADEVRGGERRAFGEGCLARAQRIYVSELAAHHDEGGTAPLSRLCPALRPLAHVMARTLESHPAAKRSVGVAFGSRAPDFAFKHGSWLPAVVLDAVPPAGYRIVVVESNQQQVSSAFLPGQLALEPEGLPAEVDRRPLRVHHPALDEVAAFAAAHRFPDQNQRRQAQQQQQRQATTQIRRRGDGVALPSAPGPVDLFAACAKLEPDLVEALVIRGRVRVDTRYVAGSPWREAAGEERAFMEPQRGMTPLCFVVTWCDVLGEDKADQLVRRLLLLRADASLDDAHPEVTFTPLASAVANGSLKIVRSLLHVGAEPDVRTSDGRTPLHLVGLAPESQRRPVLEVLLQAGADVDARVPATGDTPIHVAAKDGLLDVVTALVEFAANTLVTNAAGLTPAEAAFLELSNSDDDDGGDDQARHLRASAIARCANFLS